MLSKMPEERQEGCAPYLQNISCLECSPYSAHIFEVEDGGEERSFPLLCRSYCEEAYMKCSSVGHKPVPLMRYFRLRPNNYGVANRPRTAEKQTADAKQFCSQVASDDAYCYPNIRNGPQINGIDTQSEGELGCFCGLPVATGLRNPIVAVHAGDGSGRLFIVEQVGVIKSCWQTIYYCEDHSCILETVFLSLLINMESLVCWGLHSIRTTKKMVAFLFTIQPDRDQDDS